MQIKNWERCPMGCSHSTLTLDNDRFYIGPIANGVICPYSKCPNSPGKILSYEEWLTQLETGK